MKRSDIQFHEHASAEVLAAHRYYWKQSELAADGFILALDAALDEIAEQPTRWPRFKYGTRRIPLRRSRSLSSIS